MYLLRAWRIEFVFFLPNYNLVIFNGRSQTHVLTSCDEVNYLEKKNVIFILRDKANESLCKPR